MNKSDRRKFLKLSSLTTISSFLTLDGFSKNLESLSCEITTPDILGPYYLANAPSRTKISSNDTIGDPLVIKGIVYDSSCTPVAGAIVDVWQANSKGVYDSTDKFLLRGKMSTNANGEYQFETIVPGAYDSGGGNYRPKHIHYKVYAPGKSDLTTQLYFKNDPFISSDPWASLPSANNRIINLYENPEGKLEGIFDIYLNSVTGIHQSVENDHLGYLIQNYPNPFGDVTNIRFGIFDSKNIEITIFDTEGKQIKNLVKDIYSPGRYIINWDGRDETNKKINGLVTCVMKVDNEDFKQFKMIVQ